MGGQAGFQRLFDAKGFSRVAGTAALLPPGPPDAGGRAGAGRGGRPGGARRRAAARRGARDRRAARRAGARPAAGCRPGGARAPRSRPARRARCRRSLVRREPERLGAGAVLVGGTDVRRRRQAGAQRGRCRSRHLASRGEPTDGSGRFGTVSGSSAAAAVVAGAAALLAQARPELDASALRSALVAAARPVPGASGVAAGLVDPGAAVSVELVADPPTVGLGAALTRGCQGRPDGSSPQRLRASARDRDRRRGRDSVGGRALVRPTEARARRRDGRTRSPSRRPCRCCRARPAGWPASSAYEWCEARRCAFRGRSPYPSRGRPLLSGVRLSSESFAPSDATPAVLSLVAGRIDGRVDRPQLLPLRTLSIELYRRRAPGGHAGADQGRASRAVRVRDHRARPPRRAGSRRATYSLRIVATPVEGARDIEDVPFAIR